MVLNEIRMELYHVSSGFIVYNSASVTISTITGSIFTAALFAFLSWRWSSWCGAATIAGGHWILARNKQTDISHMQADDGYATILSDLQITRL